MAYEQQPNAGTLWHQAEKKHEKAPDFSGSVFFDPEYLQDMVNNATGNYVEVKLSGWKSKVPTKVGERNVLNIKVDTFVPTAKPKSDAKDPWDD
jgi:hypothetical protein